MGMAAPQRPRKAGHCSSAQYTVPSLLPMGYPHSLLGLCIHLAFFPSKYPVDKAKRLLWH